MDPQARRELRVQIQTYAQQGRSVLLTSHAMDECQDLCTKLGVMVNGKFVCLGSPAHLRLKFGRGYTILLKCGNGDAAAEPAAAAAAEAEVGLGLGLGLGTTNKASPAVAAAVQRLFPGAELTEEHCGYLSYAVPLDAMPPLQSAFDGLEKLRTDGAVEDYELSRTTLEDIFCQFARKQRDNAAEEDVDDGGLDADAVVEADDDDVLLD